jgi:hypothetical protein
MVASDEFCGTEHGYDTDQSEERPIREGEYEPQCQAAKT